MLSRSRTRRRPRSTRRTSGFTLLELMVVMAIMAALMGLGAGMFLAMGRRSADQQALASVNQLVTRARNASNRFPATIVPDAKTNQLHAFTDEVLQELHFDPRPEPGAPPFVPLGVDGLDCKLSGATIDDRAGRVGGAAKMNGGSVDCGKYAAYDVQHGFSVEAWMKPVASPKCEVVRKGRAISVSVDGGSNRPTRCMVKLLVQQPNGTQESIDRNATLPGVAPGEWYGLRVSFDRRELQIAMNQGYGWVVHDKIVFEKDEDRRRVLATDPDASLVVGSGLSGWLDDVRIGGIRSTEPIQMPEGMTVSGNPIRFSNGKLDAAAHPGAQRITVGHAGRTLLFTIGQDGTILSMDEKLAAADPAKPPAPERAKGQEKKE